MCSLWRSSADKIVIGWDKHVDVFFSGDGSEDAMDCRLVQVIWHVSLNERASLFSWKVGIPAASVSRDHHHRTEPLPHHGDEGDAEKIQQ